MLVDTNVLIALEPVMIADREFGLGSAAELNRLAIAQGHQLCIHPETTRDLSRDRDVERAALREQLLQKYVTLDAPPPMTSHMENVVGRAEIGTNDWVDHLLLAAVLGEAVDYLVSEDRGLHSKARQLDIESRVVTVNEAVSILRDLYDTTPETPPSVTAVSCHQLDATDPIWKSFRSEYGGFDEWLTRCKRQGRLGWVIDVDGRYAGVAIVKQNQAPAEYGLTGRTMKLCSLKVCDDFNGQRYGELLLRAVFDYAIENSYEQVVVTVFEEHWLLINLLEAFGFYQNGVTELGEQVRIKRLCPTPEEVGELDALELNIRFGPRTAKIMEGQAFIVPIRPVFHRQLFPELEMSALGGCRPCGNSMRKAYLSRASIRIVEPGAVLLFYRSEDWRAVDVIGVVEDSLASVDPDEIARFVGKSTVFDYDSIKRLCEEGEILALRFRQVLVLGSAARLSFSALRKNGVIKDAPISIQNISGGEPWLSRMTGLLY